MSTAVVMKKTRTEEMRENPGKHGSICVYTTLPSTTQCCRNSPEDFNCNVIDI